MSEGMKKVVNEILQIDEPTDFVEFPLPLEGVHKVERVIEYLTLLLYRYKDYLISDFVRDVVVWGRRSYSSQRFLHPNFPPFPLLSLIKTIESHRGVVNTRKEKVQFLRRVWRRVISPPPKLSLTFNFKVYKKGDFYILGTTFTVKRTDLNFLLDTVADKVISLYSKGEPVKEIDIPVDGELVGEGVVLLFTNPRHAIVTFHPL